MENKFYLIAGSCVEGNNCPKIYNSKEKAQEAFKELYNELIEQGDDSIIDSWFDLEEGKIRIVYETNDHDYFDLYEEVEVE